MHGTNQAYSAVDIASAQGRWGDDYDGDGPNYGEYSGFYGGGSDDGFGRQFGDGADIDPATAASYRLIHGTLAALAFVGIFPVGAILMRVVPGRFVYLVHGITQLVAYVVYICGAALGIYLVRMVRIPPNGRSLLSIPEANAHPIIGLVILAVLFFQPILGWVHHIRYRRLGCRTWWSYSHIWVGRLAVVLGIINGGLGLGLAQANRSAIIAYSVVATVMFLLWTIAAVIGERKRGRASVTAAAKARDSVDRESRARTDGSRVELRPMKPTRSNRHSSASSRSTSSARI
ncbi:hypothetical protein TruAng_010284 [Truncatella angustata]|nr:hypothetical protein TruAng_010284 [Truncatella angustata]